MKKQIYTGYCGNSQQLFTIQLKRGMKMKYYRVPQRPLGASRRPKLVSEVKVVPTYSSQYESGGQTLLWRASEHIFLYLEQGKLDLHGTYE